MGKMKIEKPLQDTSKQPLIYSYLENPDVLVFDDTYSIAVMDGECALCSFGARMIAKFDRAERIKICTIQSDLGGSLIAHYGMERTNPESWIIIQDGIGWKSFDAWIKAGECCGGVGKAMAIFWLVPRPIRDWVYLRIARNRIAMFGRADMCSLPDKQLRDRLIGGS